MLRTSGAGRAVRCGNTSFGIDLYPWERVQPTVQIHALQPGAKRLGNRPEEWRWSSCNNFALDKVTVGAFVQKAIDVVPHRSQSPPFAEHSNIDLRRRRMPIFAPTPLLKGCRVIARTIRSP
jgi:hypothetical protein